MMMKLWVIDDHVRLDILWCGAPSNIDGDNSGLSQVCLHFHCWPTRGKRRQGIHLHSWGQFEVAGDFNHCPWKNPPNLMDGVASLKNSFQQAERLMHAFLFYWFIFHWKGRSHLNGVHSDAKKLQTFFFFFFCLRGRHWEPENSVCLHCHEEALWGGTHPVGEAMRDPSSV